MKNNLRNIFFVAALLALIGAAVAQSQLNPLSSRQNSQHTMSIAIDSVMQRDDVTRVYARLIGKPHTSQRIDSITLHAPKFLSAAIGATDIDPIYFHRGFQWEDEAEMPVEIDFPPVSRKLSAYTITAITPYGNIKATYPSGR